MEQLTFTQKDGAWVCSLTNASTGTVQIVQKQRGIVSVSANIPDMPPTPVGIYENPYGNSVIFELSLPDGLDVTIKSATEVIEAAWMQ